MLNSQPNSRRLEEGQQYENCNRNGVGTLLWRYISSIFTGQIESQGDSRLVLQIQGKGRAFEMGAGRVSSQGD